MGHYRCVEAYSATVATPVTSRSAEIRQTSKSWVPDVQQRSNGCTAALPPHQAGTNEAASFCNCAIGVRAPRGDTPLQQRLTSLASIGAAAASINTATTVPAVSWPSEQSCFAASSPQRAISDTLPDGKVSYGTKIAILLEICLFGDSQESAFVLI